VLWPLLFDMPTRLDYKNNFKKMDMIIFIKEWNDKIIAHKKININQAIENLIKLNKNSNEDHFFEKDFSNMEKNYRNLLKNIKCYEFYAGFNEKEINEKLLN